MAKLIFWLQVIMACTYTVPQVIGIISGRTNGLTLALYAIFIVYLVLSLSLSVASYKLKSDVTRKRTIIIFIQWIIFIGLILFVGMGKIIWRQNDTIICIIVLCLSLITVFKYHGLKDPFSKAYLAVWCKAIPQVWLACTIVLAGNSDGLPLITLVSGHITAIPRLIQILIAGKSGGWDKPTKGLLIGESANVATWLVVTIAWAIF